MPALKRNHTGTGKGWNEFSDSSRTPVWRFGYSDGCRIEFLLCAAKSWQIMEMSDAVVYLYVWVHVWTFLSLWTSAKKKSIKQAPNNAVK